MNDHRSTATPSNPGRSLDAGTLRELEAKLLAAAEARGLSERDLAEARREARTIVTMLQRCEQMLSDLPRGLLAIGQALDHPGHLFELGSAHGDIGSAVMRLQSAQQAVQHLIDCQHCLAAAETAGKPASTTEEPGK